jgi:hypothetical protein
LHADREIRCLIHRGIECFLHPYGADYWNAIASTGCALVALATRFTHGYTPAPRWGLGYFVFDAEAIARLNG